MAHSLLPSSCRLQARLVPLIAGGMAPPRQPGARQLLQEGEGAGLLRALLRPEAALNAGQLGEAFDALQVGVGGPGGGLRGNHGAEPCRPLVPCTLLHPSTARGGRLCGGQFAGGAHPCRAGRL